MLIFKTDWKSWIKEKFTSEILRLCWLNSWGITLSLQNKTSRGWKPLTIITVQFCLLVLEIGLDSVHFTTVVLLSCTTATTYFHYLIKGTCSLTLKSFVDKIPFGIMVCFPYNYCRLEGMNCSVGLALKRLVLWLFLEPPTCSLFPWKRDLFTLLFDQKILFIKWYVFKVFFFSPKQVLSFFLNCCFHVSLGRTFFLVSFCSKSGLCMSYPFIPLHIKWDQPPLFSSFVCFWLWLLLANGSVLHTSAAAYPQSVTDRSLKTSLITLRNPTPPPPPPPLVGYLQIVVAFFTKSGSRKTDPSGFLIRV